MALRFVTVLVAMVGGAMRVSTPFLFVSLGECLTEKRRAHQPRPRGRAGAGRDGRLTRVAYETGSPWLGVLAAAVAGAALGALHGAVCALPRVNDVAIGIAMMLFGTGLAFFFGKPYIQPSAPHLPALSARATGQHRPQLRRALDVNPLFFVGLAGGARDALGAAHTQLGLHRAHRRRQRRRRPRARACRSIAIRLLATAAGGALAGIGGAFLSLYYPGSWNEGLSSGQGLMAVALVMFARWNPLGCIGAALALRRRRGARPGAAVGRHHAGLLPVRRRALRRRRLLILVATVRPGRALRGMPGELSHRDVKERRA